MDDQSNMREIRPQETVDEIPSFEMWARTGQKTQGRENIPQEA